MICGRSRSNSRSCGRTILVLALNVWVDSIDVVARDHIPTGASETVAALRGGTVDLNVYTYRPVGCQPSSVLLVFHGNGRNASSYRDSAIPVAQKHCFIVAAPLFDERRFPTWAYHRGGLIGRSGPLPSEEWTVGLVAELVEWVRATSPDIPYILFGHSAGGQFLSRVAAYALPLPPGLRRIVIANPSTYVWPSAQTLVPYGFGGDLLTDQLTHLSNYLSAPLTIYQGTDDTGDEQLTTNKYADAQGRNRLERATAVFGAACDAGRAMRILPQWQFVLAPSIGHTARGMLASAAVATGLGLEPGGQTCPRSQ